ncbi:hypothetical protein MRX96_036600 [Rhipicephalus microplus]
MHMEYARRQFRAPRRGGSLRGSALDTNTLSSVQRSRPRQPIVMRSTPPLYKYHDKATLSQQSTGAVSSTCGTSGIRAALLEDDGGNTQLCFLGQPLPKVTWLHEGVEVEPLQVLLHLFPNDTLFVEQYYEVQVQVYDEFTMAGNTAVLRCHVPSFVRVDIIVVSWEQKTGDMNEVFTMLATVANKGGGMYQFMAYNTLAQAQASAQFNLGGTAHPELMAVNGGGGADVDLSLLVPIATSLILNLAAAILVLSYICCSRHEEPTFVKDHGELPVNPLPQQPSF